MTRLVALIALAAAMAVTSLPVEAQSRCKDGQEYDADSGKCRQKRGS
jgi:hypothetical protein